MIILTFMIMKKCNMFVGGSGQRAVQGTSCQFCSSWLQGRGTCK